MKIQLIRNATMRIEYHGKLILTDPMLSEKGEIRSFAGKELNPVIDLPISYQEIINNIDFILSTHIHPDHFDDKAADIIDKKLPVYCHPKDTEYFKSKGFIAIYPVNEQLLYEGLLIIRTGGTHGSGAILERMGEVCGYILKSDGEPTVYWIGDSILTDEVVDNLIKYQPDVVITHSGAAVIPGFDKILMGIDETLKITEILPKAQIIAIHMEALDHCTVTRLELHKAIEGKGLSKDQIRIPADGEEILIY